MKLAELVRIDPKISAKQKIRAYLEDHQGSSVADISNATKIKYQTVWAALRSMKETGEVSDSNMLNGSPPPLSTVGSPSENLIKYIAKNPVQRTKSGIPNKYRQFGYNSRSSLNTFIYNQKKIGALGLEKRQHEWRYVILKPELYPFLNQAPAVTESETLKQETVSIPEPTSLGETKTLDSQAIEYLAELSSRDIDTAAFAHMAHAVVNFVRKVNHD